MALLVIDKLLPILHVRDLDAEKEFYRQLGLLVTYEGPEFPGFIGIGNEHIEFGLEQRNDCNVESTARALTWQFGISDVDETKALCDRVGIGYREESIAP